MQCVTRPRITELNPHLLCVLCGGYYIDATAIIECLHSFCKSCIIRYLETRKYCPICDVLVHKTKPLQNLRPDTVLQSIVYKLVPNLYEKEMRNRRNYYSKVPASHHPQTAEEKGVITESSKFYSSFDTIDFSLEYVNFSEHNFYVATNSQRYFRCQACVTIEQLRKLIEAKYAMSEEHRARFFYNEIELPEHLTLLDIAYMSAWKRRGFIRILYEIQLKKILIESNLKSTSSTTVVETVETAPASTPVVTSSSSGPELNPLENATKTGTSTEQSSKVIAVPEPTKESSPAPSAAKVAVTSASNVNATPGENEITVTSSSVSTTTIASCTASVSVTVTCSMNSDDITTSSVGTPIATSVCVLPVNGLSSSPKIASPISSPRATTKEEEPKEKSQPTIPVEASPAVNAVDKVTPTLQKSEDTNEKVRVAASSTKRPLEDSEKSSASQKPSTNSSEISPKPAKIPKLSGLAEKVLSANKLSSLTIEVHETAMASTTSVAAVCSTPTLTTTVTSGSSGSSGICSAVKASVTVAPASRVDCVQKSSPRPIFNRIDVPAITKSSTKINKNFNRPWNNSTSATATATTTTTTRPPLPDLIDVNSQAKLATKIIKARPTPPRYQASGGRAAYESPAPPAPPSSKSAAAVVENAVAKKSPAPSKGSFPAVMKIDPQTLSPIAATTVSVANTTVAPVSPSASKKPYTHFMPPASELYTNSGPFTSSGGLSTYTSPNLTAKPPGSYVMPNPLLPINQLMYEMYGNGTRTLEYMKAMTTTFCPPSLFHSSLLPSIGPFYNSMQKKYEKKSRLSKGTPSNQSPPSVQRIPPSNNNTKLAISEHSSGGGGGGGGEKKPAAADKHESVSNGQMKHKTKKTDASGGSSSSSSGNSSSNSGSSSSSSSSSSFSINNLIPLEMEKRTTAVVSHTCSADGIHQVCDQMPTKKNDHKESAETKKTAAESKLNNASKE